MIQSFLLIFILLGFPHSAWSAELPSDNSCVACHDEVLDDFKGSIHAQQGVLCQSCHGGDATKADQESAHALETGFIGVPDKKQTAALCGSCHSDVEKMNFYGIRTDQLARYKTSMHGKKLLVDGDTHVAVCSDCHGAHDVLPVSDPGSYVYPSNLPKTCAHCHANEKLMSGYQLPSDVFHKYEGSVHGQALFIKKDTSVAQCASCHGSHGAMPPGVKDIGDTCGKCHINEKKYFLESAHAKLTDKAAFSECVSCHSNHDIEKPSPALYATACAHCHVPGSEGDKLARKLSDIVRRSDQEFQQAQALVKQASIEGIFVEDETQWLEEAKTEMISMAPLQHTLSVKAISEPQAKISEKVTSIRTSIEKKRENLKLRKQMLIPIWIFVLIMSAALLGKYNELRHKKKNGENGHG